MKSRIHQIKERAAAKEARPEAIAAIREAIEEGNQERALIQLGHLERELGMTAEAIARREAWVRSHG